MSSSAKSLLDNLATFRAILRSVVRRHGNSYHAKHLTKILNPFTEQRPGHVTNRFSQAMILDHVTHLQILIRHKVVRPHHAPCCLNGKVFTLATYFEVLACKFISKLGSIIRTLFSLRHPALQPLQRLFALAKMSRISDCFPVAIGVEVVQTNINTDSFTSWLSAFYSLLVNAKLAIIAICTTDNPHSFKLFKLVEMQVTGSPKLKGSCFKTIRKSDIPAVIRKFPSTSFVFYRTVRLVFLELWKSLFPWFAFFAVIIREACRRQESSNCRPSSFSASLSCHRVQLGNPRKLCAGSKDSAELTEVVSPNTFVIHPVPKACIANKTSSSNRFIKRLILSVFSFKFSLKYQHIYVKNTNVNHNMDLRKTQLFPLPYWLIASYGREFVSFFALDSSRRQIKDYGGSLLSDLGKFGNAPLRKVG